MLLFVVVFRKLRYKKRNFAYEVCQSSKSQIDGSQLCLLCLDLFRQNWQRICSTFPLVTDLARNTSCFILTISFKYSSKSWKLVTMERGWKALETCLLYLMSEKDQIEGWSDTFLPAFIRKTDQKGRIRIACGVYIMTSKLNYSRGSLVSDIPAGDGKLVNLFYGVAIFPSRHKWHPGWGRENQ
jgi:hypothetical protein